MLVPERVSPPGRHRRPRAFFWSANQGVGLFSAPTGMIRENDHFVAPARNPVSVPEPACTRSNMLVRKNNVRETRFEMSKVNRSHRWRGRLYRVARPRAHARHHRPPLPVADFAWEHRVQPLAPSVGLTVHGGSLLSSAGQTPVALLQHLLQRFSRAERRHAIGREPAGRVVPR